MSGFSIKYPFFILMMCLVIAVVGSAAIARMPVDLFPSINIPVVVVATFYNGMPPEQIETDITGRFERFFTLGSGIDHIESRSLPGVSLIKVYFQPGTDADAAVSAISNLAMADLRKLPPGTLPPVVLKFDASSLPVCLITLKGRGLGETQLRDLGQYAVRNQVANVAGASVPQPFGGKYRQIMVYVDPLKLEANQLSVMDVVRKVNESNLILPAGDVKIGPKDYNIYTNSQLPSTADINRVPLKTVGNASVMVADVGHAADAQQIQTSIVRVDGQKSVYLPVLKQGGDSNTIQIVNGIRDRLNDLLDVPGSLVANVVFDQSVFVKTAIKNLGSEGGIGLVLTALMILIFLGSIRGTFAVMLSIPLSALATFLALSFGGGTINSMVLGGLALAFSRLIDNSVVVLENIFRHLEMGESPQVAAERGGQEVALPVLAATFTTAIVFFPVIFLYGVSRFLFIALASSVVLSLFASYVVAMTVVPLYCARFIKNAHNEAAHHKGGNWFERIVRDNRYIWLGTQKKLDAFTFDFKETDWGWFNLHAYRFDHDWSTFIVETPERNWLKAGIDKMEVDESIALCERLFAERLDGNALISNARHLRGPDVWQKFNRVLCEQWHHKNIVLIGDAAHTAHFGIGSGTKLAMEDAMALARVLSGASGDVCGALHRYQEEREIEALKLQSAARNRMEWFEQGENYVHLEPEQFTYSLLTGSQRIGHENLKLRDANYVNGVERWFAERSGIDHAVPPMFTPFTVRGLTLKNRVIVSPMATYMAEDGMPNDFHLVHLGSRAMGGAAMVVTEMTCVSPEGRITPACPGMWNDEQQQAWKRVVDYVHTHTTAKIALQLGHSGRKGSTRRGWEGIDLPLDSGNWPLLSASAIPYIKGVSQIPREATRADMDRIKAEFVAATERGIVAGFDWLEFHCAHGYLLSSFISPLTNQRTDEYGGTLPNRCRYPLEVFKAMRAVWPQEKPMSVRISATDWVPGGITPQDAAEIARLFCAAGADIIDCSSGQVSKQEKPVYGRMFQVPFSDRIRNQVGIPTIAVGNIFEGDHVNTIIAAGRADLCAIARAHLADPSWTHHQAANQCFSDIWWPEQYSAGKDQLERNTARAALLAVQV